MTIPRRSGRPAITRAEAVIAVAIAMAVVILAVWVYANEGIGMLWFLATAVVATGTILFAYPYAVGCRHANEGAVAVWLALLLGPLSLAILVPWARRLGPRFDAASS
jgi:hypothetical protein